MTKSCTKCGDIKPLTEFHKNSKNNDGYAYHCKACRKEESLKTYGLTLEDYDDLLDKQNGCCAICGTEDPRGQSKAGRFYVDHNHKTGEVRGLLCNDCNTALGLFKDSTELLASGIKYLNSKGTYGE
jgi:hypothetical protein